MFVPDDPPQLSLTMLPSELLFEIVVRSPLRSLRHVLRIDVRLLSCVRIQRWFRGINRKEQAALNVGNRVLVRLRSGCGRGLGYAFGTTAAMMNRGSMWKVCILCECACCVSVPTHRIRRLSDWADVSCTSSVGRFVALASASKARSAATHAASVAAQAMRTGTPSAQSALAIAAASAASTAAAAATVASSVAAPLSANQVAPALEARELLLAAQQMQEALAQAGVVGEAASGVHDCVAAAASADEGVASLMAVAANAAAEAATEASAAASAASAVDSIGPLDVTASTAATAATAAQQVVEAVEALERAPATAAHFAVEVAVEALTDVRVAGRALTRAWAQGCDSSGGCDAAVSASHTAAQAAARMLGGNATSLLPSSAPETPPHQVVSSWKEVPSPSHATLLSQAPGTCYQGHDHERPCYHGRLLVSFLVWWLLMGSCTSLWRATDGEPLVTRDAHLVREDPRDMGRRLEAPTPTHEKTPLSIVPSQRPGRARSNLTARWPRRRLTYNASAADEWLGSAKKGFCGHTVAGAMYDCKRGLRGSIGLSIRASASLGTAVRVCMDACHRCERCNFITVNPAVRECSWFHRCPMDRLPHQYEDFLSGQVAKPPAAKTVTRRNGTGEDTLQELLLFMHLEKTAGTLVRETMRRHGWAYTKYCSSPGDILTQVLEMLASGERFIFAEHHCNVDWCARAPPPARLRVLSWSYSWWPLSLVRCFCLRSPPHWPAGACQPSSSML